MRILMTVVFLMSLNALAKEGGNGGDSIVCRNSNGEIISTELLDYYEGRVMRNFSTLEYPNFRDDEFFQIVGDKFNSMEDWELPLPPFNIEEAQELMNAIHEFLKTGSTSIHGILFTNEILTDILDSEQLIIPKNCKVEQLAIWQHPRFFEDPRFIIQADILKQLSLRDLRGLVLHEILYKALHTLSRFRGEEIKDSYSVRYLHEKLLAKNWEAFTFSEYLNFIQGMYKNSDKGRIRINDLYLSTDQIGIYPDRIEMDAWIGKDIRFVLDKKGQISSELTMKYGSVKVTPYTRPILSSWNPGTITINGKTVQIPKKGNPVDTLRFKMGENTITLSINPDDDFSRKFYTGIVFRRIDGKEEFYEIEVTSTKFPQTITKKIFIDKDKYGQIIIR